MKIPFNDFWENVNIQYNVHSLLKFHILNYIELK